MAVNYKDVEHKAREMRENIAKFEKTFLELMVHPEATPEQIEECRVAYIDMKKRVREVNAKLFNVSHGWYRIIKI